MAKALQLDRSQGWRGSKYLKRVAVKYRRRMEKQDPENAPKGNREVIEGYSS